MYTTCYTEPKDELVSPSALFFIRFRSRKARGIVLFFNPKKMLDKTIVLLYYSLRTLIH